MLQGRTNPDSIVRYDAEDPGHLTEFKTLYEASTTAVKNDIIKAGKQLAQYGGGDVVIDGRNVALTEEAARHGHARAVGQARRHGQALPQRVLVLVGNTRIIVLDERQT